MVVSKGKIKERISDTNWFVYVLKLEENKFYVGIAVDPIQRFEQHKNQGKNCSSWCKKYKALKIIEVIDTKTRTMKDATYFEDLKTLEYIESYGFENVRGGRYLGSNSKIGKSAGEHLKRGFISIPHLLFERFNITYEELNLLNLYSFVTDQTNMRVIEDIVTETPEGRNQRKIIIEKIVRMQQAADLRK